VKKGFKIAGIVLSVVLMMVLAIYGILQTRWAKTKVANLIESIANDQMEGTLTLGKIEGNLFTQFSLQDLLLSHEKDTLLV
jgi:autotransporter translocation and assembly factor TamB